MAWRKEGVKLDVLGRKVAGEEVGLICFELEGGRARFGSKRM